MWRGGLGAAGERGGPVGKGEYAAELIHFRAVNLNFPRGNLWLCNVGNSLCAELSTEPPRTPDHCEREFGPQATHHSISLFLKLN